MAAQIKNNDQNDSDVPTKKIAQQVKEKLTKILEGVKQKEDQYNLKFYLTLFTLLFVGIQTCSLNEQVGIGNRQIEAQLAKERPFITVEPRLGIDESEKIVLIRYIFINTSDIPGRIICSVAKFSIKGIGEDKEQDSDNCDTTPRVIYSTKEPAFNLSVFGFSHKDTEDIHSGKERRVKMAACIVFKSLNEKDPKTWIANVKHIFTTETLAFDTISINELTVPGDHKTCTIDLPRGK